MHTPFALVASIATLLLMSSNVHRVFAANCNGYSELCSKSYSNISYVGTHDSFSVAAGSLAADQNYPVTTQLDNGVRMLSNQGHNSSGEIHLCHTSCLLLDAGTLTDYLTKVKSWLDANSDEVITLLWVNSDSFPVSQWAAAYTATGMDTYAYTPTSTPVAYSAWPTLQDLINSGKRAVSFMDYGADYSTCPYILDHFTHFWETPYDSTDSSFPCTVDRGSASTQMYMINHYLDKNISFFGTEIPVPDKTSLETTNGVSGAGSLGLNVQQCAAQHGQYPTFMLVDFYDVGNGSVFQVAANLNDVTYNAVPIGNGSQTSSGDDASSSSSSHVNAGSLAAIHNLIFVAFAFVAVSVAALA